MSEEKNRTVGWGTCKWCGLEDQPIKVNKKGHLYFICAPEADGGCNHQHQPRGALSDRLLAEQVTRWKSKEERAKWLQQNEPEPEPVDDPEPEPLDDPEPEQEDDPPPPPRRQPTKRRAPPPPAPAPKKKPAAQKRKGLFVWE